MTVECLVVLQRAAQKVPCVVIGENSNFNRQNPANTFCVTVSKGQILLLACGGGWGWMSSCSTNARQTMVQLLCDRSKLIYSLNQTAQNFHILSLNQ